MQREEAHLDTLPELFTRLLLVIFSTFIASGGQLKVETILSIVCGDTTHVQSPQWHFSVSNMFFHSNSEFNNISLFPYHFPPHSYVHF